MKEFAIGIDIGGTNTVIGLVDHEGNVITDSNIPTAHFYSVEKFIDAVCKEIDKMIPEDVTIKGIGIGAPNSNFYTGTIEYAPNLNFKGVIPLVKLFKEKYNFPIIVLTNDANAAAIGEMVYGGAKGMKDFILITLGTGLGSGIVVNGELVYGHGGLAGELGHVVIENNGRLCNCGRKGCLETYASATGLVKTAQELVRKSDQNSLLNSFNSNELTSKIVFEAAEKGDSLALEIFDRTAEYLGKALANSVAYTSPEAIFIFGGLANSGSLMIDPVKKYMEENLLEVYKGKVKIIKSKLPGSHAAVLGASSLVWKEASK